MKTMFLVINSLYGGGAEHVASRLSVEWAKKYKLYIISLCSQTEDDYDFAGNIISISDSYCGNSTLTRVRNAAKRIDKLAEKLHPELIVSFLQNANLSVMLTKCSAKKIISIRNYVRGQYKGVKLFFWEMLIRLYFRRADHVVSVSDAITAEMVKRYRISADKCRTIYNPYEVRSIIKKSLEPLPDETESFITQHPFVISNMGHLSRQKGQFHLIRVLAEVRKIHPEAGLILIGNDATEFSEKLKSLTSELGLTDHVIFTGSQRNPYKFLKASSCFMFTSLYEGFPNALAEAMICGLPVISTDCRTGPNEILQGISKQGEPVWGKYGCLIQNDSKTEWLGANDTLTEQERSMVAAIIKLIEDKALFEEKSQIAASRAHEFSMQKIITEWECILN